MEIPATKKGDGYKTKISATKEQMSATTLMKPATKTEFPLQKRATATKRKFPL
ncbi:hypothetical protein [Bacillus sp. V59.32b]|uniref:hypothetical protein n=1 Tax=Bacillus sp. V59.32b TaxID=1758642 RepID=UPI0013576914|nr:hypothetical protein [Bacillus sp. V59.32b]